MTNNLSSEISRVDSLFAAYERIQHDEHNPIGVCNAFHEWYDAASVLFSEYFEGDANYDKFISVETDGNQYVLGHIFDDLRAPYKILMNKLKKGNLPTTAIATEEKSSDPYIFISHASADKDLIQLFKTHILKAGLGYTDEQIAYTSDEASGVPAGDSIPEYIKRGIGKAQVVLLMVSEAYRASEVCLNEMGAAWALDKKPISVLLPNVSFDKLGWLTSLNKAIKIDDDEMLGNLEEVICKMANLQSPKIPSWNQCVKNFLVGVETLELKVQASTEGKDSPFLTFNDNETSMSIELPFVVSNYLPKPQPVQRPSTTDILLGGNLLAATKASFAQAEAEVSPVKITALSNGVKINQSMAQIDLIFHNPGGSLENVDIIVEGENLRFDDDVRTGSLIIHRIDERFICSENRCTFKKGTCNAGMQSGLHAFYVEPQDICGEYEGYEDVKEREYKLHYTISTKENPYSGELTLRVKPHYEYSDPIYNDEKAGGCKVEFKKEDEKASGMGRPRI